jgi:cell filamentation protein
VTVDQRRLSAPVYGIEKAHRQRGMSPEQIAWEDYFIPGTATMRNKFGASPDSYGVTDPNLLRTLEEQFSMSHMLELQKQPIEGRFDLDHMKKIHAHLFGSVYEWAGQERTVNLVKAGHVYAPLDKIEPMWAQQHRDLTADGMLRGISDPGEFSDKLAKHWGWTNVAHAFREGNTRSQTVFYRQLADEAGWDLDTTRLDPKHPESIRDEFIAARFHHQDNNFDHGPLAETLRQALTLREPQPHRERYQRFPELAPESRDRTGAGPYSDAPEY